MEKANFLIILMILLWVKLFSQTSPTIQWQKCLGGTNVDYATSIQQTTDGGFIMSGTTISNDGNVSGNHEGKDYWIVKLSSPGSIQWQKCLGGTGDEDGCIKRQRLYRYSVSSSHCICYGNCFKCVGGDKL
ncbi:MAG: hypothetical protein ACHQK8_03955 [Bacteroidia bacterium]